MTKSKQEFIDQTHDKVFNAWWKENEILYPSIQFKQAKDIFIAGRLKYDEQFIKQKKLTMKIEMEKRNLQSKIDKILLEATRREK